MATAVLVFLAGASELALRVAGVQPGYRVDVAGWMARPMRAQSELMTRPGTIQTFRITINDDGLRTSLPKVRTPGVTRIALFGDSTLFGWGVDDGETMPAAMHDTLTRRGIRAEVLNAGQPGYSTTQIEHLYTNTVSAYTPDIVVVFVPQHDGNLVPVSDRERIEGASGPVSAVRILLANHSRVYYLLRKSLSGVTDAQPVRAAASEAQGDLVPRASHAERDATMDRLRTALAERGAPWSSGTSPSATSSTAPPSPASPCRGRTPTPRPRARRCSTSARAASGPPRWGTSRSTATSATSIRSETRLWAPSRRTASSACWPRASAPPRPSRRHSAGRRSSRGRTRSRATRSRGASCTP